MKNLITNLLFIGALLTGSATWAHDRPAREAPHGRGWIGVGAGVGWGSVDEPCTTTTTARDCEESGGLATYSANATLSSRGGGTLRVRGVRDADEDEHRTPYETAALIGTRFGRSNWYGLVGAGRIRHADDGFKGDTHGFAWEVLFAPASRGPVGFELSFLGNAGEEVDFVAFGLGMRLGAMR